MKHKRTKPPPISVPRSGSLLCRLQHAPEPEEGALPYLDQLMIFLDDPPAGVRDRWKKGAKMCTAWGISCTHASVWRLYRSYAIEWRQRLSHETDFASNENPEMLEERLAKLTTLRSIEALANPQLSPECIIGLARIEQRKAVLEFARDQHREQMDFEGETYVDKFIAELNTTSGTRELWDKMCIAMGWRSPKKDDSKSPTTP